MTAYVTIADAVTAICLRAGLDMSQFDVSALATITEPLRAMAISQVTSARQVLDMLGAAYFFDAVASDRIYFRPRGSAPVRTLSYDDLGWHGDGQDIPDPLALVASNELELPAQVALTYNNIDGDYQTDTQYSDRLLTGMRSTNALTLPIGLTPAHAKQIADAMLVDSAVGLLATALALGTIHSDLEPTDVIIATARDGSTYRLRLVKRADAGGVSSFEAMLDDPSVLVQPGITVGGLPSQTVVLAVPDSVFLPLDIGLLRDADNAPGYYLAVSGGGSSAWRSAGVFDSPDDTTYTLQRTVDSQAVIGETTTALANWLGGNTWDEAGTVTVAVDGQLTSATSADVIARRATNAILIGDEHIQFRTATLVSPGVYTLTGMLRGRRGTEWAMGTHAIGDRVVALGNAGVRFMALQSSELGVTRYLKVATAGQPLSAVTAKSAAPMGIVLKPFAPALASADRTTGDTVIDWYRRTRLSSRITGPLAWSNPLGEAVEAYEVDVFADGTYTTLKRTLTASTSQATYTGADQVTDFGAPQTTLYLDIYQISAIVGRGYRLRVAV